MLYISDIIVGRGLPTKTLLVISTLLIAPTGFNLMNLMQ
jgi:hypothetical protein